MIELLDCTLRDGANICGKGFPADITKMILEGLSNAKVPYVEFGNSGGIGAYEVAGFTDAETDATYLDLLQPFLIPGRTSQYGMFLNATRYREKNIAIAKDAGLDFIRVGAEAGRADIALEIIKEIKKCDMKAFYACMKAYLSSPEELVDEALKLQDAGLEQFTIMDSAGTLLPEDVSAYVSELKRNTALKIGFHGHNNLGMSAANAMAAYTAGADFLDGGLMGMARSAGKASTEVLVSILQRKGEFQVVDLYALLDCIEAISKIIEERYDYHNPIPPLDLIYGISGAHSSKGKLFKQVAGEKEVPLYRLIIETSKIDKRNPSAELMEMVAEKLK